MKEAGSRISGLWGIQGLDYLPRRLGSLLRLGQSASVSVTLKAVPTTYILILVGFRLVWILTTLAYSIQRIVYNVQVYTIKFKLGFWIW